ncbi:protein kinase, ATP binding site-containing protein [Tanacetum coccineum]
MVQGVHRHGEYYEGTQRSRQERPGEVAENSSGTAGIERPQAFAGLSVEIVDTPEDGTPRKTARDDVKMEGNKDEKNTERVTGFCGRGLGIRDKRKQQRETTTDSTSTIRSQLYQKLEDLSIPLKEIKRATCDFCKTSEIGKGGFGVVYQGRLSDHWKNHEVAIKRLDKTGYQGKKEFLNELKLIFKFHHQNIIPSIGYCDEGEEMILVYEYANNGSLDYHLKDKNRRRCLTWVKRLKICLGAAKGLDYLHTGLGEDNRVIHRDVKSGNILLDENMEAKICDFGLSKSDSAKQQQTKLYTGTAGTNYYTDPIYHEGGILRSDSDVYSFGVVMFEILSGMLAWYRRKIRDDKPRPLINLVRRHFDYGKELLIDPEINDQIYNHSFQTFIATAYQCISFNSKERPTMEMIADKIEEAIDFQVSLDHIIFKDF